MKVRSIYKIADFSHFNIGLDIEHCTFIRMSLPRGAEIKG
jgi:hypothetical protein